MNSQNPQVAFSAARWIAEMVLGKPSQAIQVEHGGKELATAFANALREVIMEARALPPTPARLEDGRVRVLGATYDVSDDDFPN